MNEQSKQAVIRAQAIKEYCKENVTAHRLVDLAEAEALYACIRDASERHMCRLRHIKINQQAAEAESQNVLMFYASGGAYNMLIDELGKEPVLISAVSINTVQSKATLLNAHLREVPKAVVDNFIKTYESGDSM